MARRIKELMLAELEQEFRDITQTGCVLVNYVGLKAGDADALRQSVREKDAQMTVVKNSTLVLALQRLGAGELAPLVDGPTAVVRAQDPVGAAKTAKEMAKACDAITIRGGFADGNVIGVAGVEKLATIPSREALLSMLAGAFLQPLRRLATGLLARPRELLSCIGQLKEKRESAGAD